MTRALRTAVFGVLLCVVAGAFDLAALYVPGVALIVVGLGAIAWVWLAAQGATVIREPAPATVQEDEPYPLRLRSTRGVLPAPAGELIEPLLGHPLPATDPRSKRVRVNVRFSRRGRRTLEPARLVIRDPLSLAKREVVSGTQRAARAAADRARGAGAGGRRRRRNGDRQRRADRGGGRARAALAQALPHRLAGLAHPLAHGGPHGGDGGAPAGGGRRRPPAGGARPPRSAEPRGARQRRARHGVAGGAPGAPRRRLLAAPAGRPPRHEPPARPARLAGPARPPRAARGERRRPELPPARAQRARVLGQRGRRALPPTVKRGAGSYFITPSPIEGRLATFAVAGCRGYRLSGLRKRAAA